MNNFEKNINRIEEIANKVENNDLQIDEMSKLYQEGMNLISISEKELKKIEKDIEKIKNKNFNKETKINIKNNIKEIEKIHEKFLNEDLNVDIAVDLYKKAVKLIKESERVLEISEKNFKIFDFEN